MSLHFLSLARIIAAPPFSLPPRPPPPMASSVTLTAPSASGGADVATSVAITEPELVALAASVWRTSSASSSPAAGPADVLAAFVAACGDEIRSIGETAGDSRAARASLLRDVSRLMIPVEGGISDGLWAKRFVAARGRHAFPAPVLRSPGSGMCPHIFVMGAGPLQSAAARMRARADPGIGRRLSR
jgi:hypothetical protein